MANQKPLVLKDGKKSEMVSGVDTIDPVFLPPSSGLLPQYNSDPLSPSSQTAWVRKNTLIATGSPIGLLLALTSVGSFSYDLRYRTLEGTTVGVPLT